MFCMTDMKSSAVELSQICLPPSLTTEPPVSWGSQRDRQTTSPDQTHLDLTWLQHEDDQSSGGGPGGHPPPPLPPAPVPQGEAGPLREVRDGPGRGGDSVQNSERGSQFHNQKLCGVLHQVHGAGESHQTAGKRKR